MNRWLDHINTVISRLLADEQPVLVAVSGGVDSMVLLRVLAELAPQHRWKLAAAHFNHQLRGAASDADAELVRKTAQELQIPIFTDRGDVKAEATASKISIEMAARQLRYGFLSRTAREQGIGAVAVAHHAGDQAELFFLRLFRGAGTIGLGGMKPVAPLPCGPEIRLIRPFLNEPKETLRQFATEQQIPFAEDATNASLDIQRNRIRNELIPLLEQHYQPALSQTIRRAMDIVQADGEFVTVAAENWLQHYGPEPFDELPIALQRRSLQLQLLALGQEPSFDAIEWLRLNPGKTLIIDEQTRALRQALGTIQTLPAGPTKYDFPQDTLEIDLTQSNSAEFAGLKVQWKLSDESVGNNKHGNMEWFDANRVGTQVQLRLWRPGDRFQPIGNQAPSKLQDLFTNAKVPRPERHNRVVAAQGGGEIFWVEGLRISERFKLDNTTVKRLKWTWSR